MKCEGVRLNFKSETSRVLHNRQINHGERLFALKVSGDGSIEDTVPHGQYALGGVSFLEIPDESGCPLEKLLDGFCPGRQMPPIHVVQPIARVGAPIHLPE